MLECQIVDEILVIVWHFVRNDHVALFWWESALELLFEHTRS